MTFITIMTLPISNYLLTMFVKDNDKKFTLPKSVTNSVTTF